MARPTTGDAPSGPPLMPYSPAPGGLAVPTGSPFGGMPAAPGAAAKNAPTLPAMLHALRRRWVLATFIGTLVASVAALVVWVSLPTGKHTAKVVLKIAPPGAEVVHRMGEDMEGYRRTQTFLLRSRDLINRTLADPAVASLPSIRDVEDPAKIVEDNLMITVPAPDILLVSLTGDHPDDMKVILDTMAKKFVTESSAEDRKLRDEQLVKLEQTYDKFKRELTNMEAGIRRMVETHGGSAATDSKPQIDVMQQHITETRLANDKMNTELIALDAKIRLKRAQLKAAGEGKEIELDPDEVKMRVLANSRVGPIAARLELTTQQLAADKKYATDENAPTIVRLKTDVDRLTAELRDAKNAVQPEVEKELRSDTLRRVRGELALVEIEYQVLKETHAARVVYVNNLQREMRATSVGQFDVTQLMRELDPQREYNNKIKAQIVQLQAQKEQGSRINIREGPFVSMNQNLQKKAMMATAAALGAFAGVVVLIGFLEWRTRRIDGVDQVVNDLSMRIIGTIPAFPTKASLKAADRHGAANWRFVLNESINSTRTMLLHAARNNSMQVVMVTSATQGEGKTSLASQLATSMATAGMRTLIVDCDLRNPSMHKLFDVQITPGTCEVLLQDVDASEAVQLTSVPNLWMLPAGRCSNSTIAALAQGHPLETLFNRLRGQFDFIIVDSCPVLPVADALLIGQHVDGVVFSIMQDISQLPKVMVASERLQQLNIPLLGAVVNGIRNDVYSYGYNYIKQLPA